MAQSHIGLRELAARQGEDIRAERRCGFFPLTPALSLGERVNQSLRREQSRPVGFPLRTARCSLSLRERVRVRGNVANCPLAYRSIPETVVNPALYESTKLNQNARPRHGRRERWLAGHIRCDFG